MVSVSSIKSLKRVSIALLTLSTNEMGWIMGRWGGMCAEASWIGDGAARKRADLEPLRGQFWLAMATLSAKRQGSPFSRLFFRLAFSSFPASCSFPQTIPSLQTKDFFSVFVFLFVFAFCQLTRSSCLTLVHPSSPIHLHQLCLPLEFHQNFTSASS